MPWITSACYQNELSGALTGSSLLEESGGCSVSGAAVAVASGLSIEEGSEPSTSAVALGDKTEEISDPDASTPRTRNFGLIPICRIPTTPICCIPIWGAAQTAKKSVAWSPLIFEKSYLPQFAQGQLYRRLPQR